MRLDSSQRCHGWFKAVHLFGTITNMVATLEDHKPRKDNSGARVSGAWSDGVVT